MPSNSKFLSSVFSNNSGLLVFPIASFVFTEIHIQYFFSVRYRKSNELKSRALLNRHWHLMYLHISLIQCCRYLCGNRCICKAWYSLLQMFFSWPMYLQLAFLWACRCFSACLACTIASASHIFDNLRMLLIEIIHPQLALSITCRYSPQKFCIFNPRKSTIADIVTQYP